MNYWKPEEEPLKKGQEVTMFNSHLRPEIMLSLHNGLNTILIVGKGGGGEAVYTDESCLSSGQIIIINY